MFAHGPAHIPQPPHTSGKPFSGLRTRIDPGQIPSPVEVAENDEETWEGRPFMTLPGEHVPLSTTNFVSIDQGNSSPRFVRATTWHIPFSAELADACQIPLAAIVQPFAEVQQSEDNVPVVDFGEIGPARCEQCRAYINPWLLPEYFCNLDSNQMRLDQLQRPELTKGTVDFVVSSEYFAPHAPPRLVPSYYSPEPQPEPTSRRVPEPIRIMFAIDVSREAVQCGLVRAACEAIIGVLYGREMDDGVRMEPCFPTQCKVGIMTFDTTVHFYDVSAERNAAVMLVIPDIEDEIFCPLQDGAFVDPNCSRNVIENLLSEIPKRFEAESTLLCALGAAMRGCLASFARHGGQVILFQSSMCSVGPGVSEARLDESKLYDTDREKQLFQPCDSMWMDLAEEMAEEGVGVCVLAGTGVTAFVDFGSIGSLAATTGGDLRLFPRFDPVLDALPFRTTLTRLISRFTGYTCRARVRVSRGLCVKALHGALLQGASGAADGEAALGVLHADAAFGVKYAHAGRGSLDARGHAHLQCAVLYTTREGQRRVRVLNVALQVAALAGNVFRYADAEATSCYLAKEAMTSLSSHTLSNIRDSLTEKCSSILLAYRRNCAAATSPSQLILPEAFKLLPLYTLTIHKNRGLRAHNVPADVRNYYAKRLLGMPVCTMLRHLYPRFMALHDLTDSIALPTPSTEANGTPEDRSAMQLPSVMRDTFVGMQGNGVFLIDNEEIMVIWFGSRVSPQTLLDLLGVESSDQIDSRMSRLPDLPTRLSMQVRNILSARRAERGGIELRLLVARQNLDAAEIEMSDMLVEDQNCGAMSYIDYLCFVHKQINVALTNNTSIESVTSYGLRGTPW
ncbi:hypothetical protein EW145_g2180 [Phellinidium pouzarii]|uniref:Sec23/Sec24 trunk domain-containing protein n=1 Tax=Phellinidium pouzarii TaxID=167371 RepID=A0A4S4LDS5_9AGAM|nr:hypothetical protein EW145_g2180 [Phellinidium pouzarii]